MDSGLINSMPLPTNVIPKDTVTLGKTKNDKKIKKSEFTTT